MLLAPILLQCGEGGMPCCALASADSGMLAPVRKLLACHSWSHVACRVGAHSRNPGYARHIVGGDRGQDVFERVGEQVAAECRDDRARRSVLAHKSIVAVEDVAGRGGVERSHARPHQVVAVGDGEVSDLTRQC